MKYKCNHCGEVLSEEEESQMCDCGCPSCRRDKGAEEIESSAPELDMDCMGNCFTDADPGQ